MKVMLTYKNFLLARSNSYPRKKESSKSLLLNTLDRWLETYQQHKFDLCEHQHTELLAGNYPKRKQSSTSRQKLQNHKFPDFPTPQKPSDLQKPDIHSDKCTRCGDTLHVKGFQCPIRKFQCKICHKFRHFTTVCYQKSQQPSSSFKTRKPKAQQLCKQGPYTPIMMLIEVDLNCQIMKDHSVYR